MFVHAGNKKRNIRKKCVLLAGLLALFVLPAGARQKQKDLFGVYTGWAFSLKDKFIDEAPGGHTFNHYMPNFILGVYLQHDFSGLFGLQLNANYLNCSNHWEFSYWERHEEGTNSINSFSFSLNGIATVGRSAKGEFYFLGGIGMFTGAFDYRRSFCQFSGGTGVKLRVRPGARTSVNLAAVFHHFWYAYGGASNADYLSFQAGLEYSLKDKRDNP